MHRSRWAAAALAVALVVLMVATALPSSSPPSGPHAPLKASPALVASDRGEYAFLSDLAAGIHVPLAQLEKEQAWADSLTPAQQSLLMSTYHAMQNGSRPSEATLSALGLQPDDAQGVCIGATIIAGATIGLLTGNPIGVLIGAVAGGIAGYYACQTGVSAGSNSAAFKAWSNGLYGAVANEFNLTAAGYLSLVSSLNVSKVGWERAADNAATLQLNKSSFNVSVDLYQSGVLANLAPVISGYAHEVGEIVASLAGQINGYGGTSGVFAANTPQLGFATVAAACNSGYDCVAVNGNSATLIGYGVRNGESNVYISGGSQTFFLECTTGGTATFKNLLTNATFTATYPTGVGFSAYWFHYGTVNVPAGIYSISTPGCTGNTGPVLANSQDAAVGPSFADPAVAAVNDGGSAVDPGGFSGPSDATSAPNVALLGNIGSGVQIMWQTSAFPGALDSNLGKWVGAIEYDAATNAQAYWTFLRTAGFHNLSQIPPDCFIPEPYMVMPAQISNVTLNASEWEALYLAALQGMGAFYNVSLNATSFCGATATRQWSIGSAPWGNLAVNATGYVYLTNGTQPIDLRGKPFNSEKFGSHSTWAVGNTTYYNTVHKGSQQLLLMPTLATVSIPVGQVWEVPASDPIQIYAVQSGVMFKATGNGTSTGVKTSLLHVATVQPGDAIYLTSCVVGGSAASNCTVEVATLNVTVANITCNGPCSQGASGGTFGGLPNPFSWLTNWLSGLFGGGPLGNAIAGIVSALIILVVIGILVYVAVVSVESWGSKKRGGGSSTIVVGGR